MGNLRSPHAHSDIWNMMSNIGIVNILSEKFGDVAILPNQYIINELRACCKATIELLEDRLASSVYRIRQTGVVYQIEAEDGKIFEFDNYDDYLAADPIDKPIVVYLSQMPGYTIVRIDESKIYITRNRSPRFACILDTSNDGLNSIQFTEIHDPIPPAKASKYMQTIGALVSKFLRDEQQRQ